MQTGGVFVVFPLAVPLPGQAFVVVVYGHRQYFFGFVLPHHLVV